MKSSEPSYSILPKFFNLFKEGYSWRTFAKDCRAGLIVGIIALPLALAFAIASGVKPVQGIYTGVIAGFLISFFGGSRFQIGGPTGAFVVVIFNIVHRFGYDGLVLATLLAGLLLIVLGLIRAGSFIKFIPYPVTVGFTSGIAVLIAVSQLKDLLGLPISAMPPEFVGKIFALFRYGHQINLWAAAVGIGSLGILIAWPKRWTALPGSLVVIVLATLAVQMFRLPIATIQSAFGDLPKFVWTVHWPRFTWELFQQVLPSAVTIALLAGMESLLSALVADGMTGRRHRSNAEMIAQGVANIASVSFGGIPATGAIARTAVNIKQGAQTPVAGMVHALVLLLLVLGFRKWAALIPLPALAALLLMVAYQMSEWRVFAGMFRYPWSEIGVLLTTFGLTVLLDLTVAIQVGMILAMFLLMQRMAEVTQTGFLTTNLREDEDLKHSPPLARSEIPRAVEVFEINGIFFFGAIDAFKSAISRMQKKPRVFILLMRNVLYMDATGQKELEELHARLRREGTQLVLCGIHAQPLHAMIQSGFYKILGKTNITATVPLAMKRANALLEK
jgi:SulP family sulfate permease